MACQGVPVKAHNSIGVGWTNELRFNLAYNGTRVRHPLYSIDPNFN